MKNYFNPSLSADLIRRSLKEDIGKRDITTVLFIPPKKRVAAVILVKEPCVVCGLDIARQVLQTLDKNIRFQALVKDGAQVKRNQPIARIKGKLAAILTAERVALNFLSLLSGVATRTRGYVDAVKPYKVRVMDTRKTIPGLRLLQKYAVKIGGGYNHRMRLDEMIMLKDNHLKSRDSAYLSSIFPRKISRRCPYLLEIEAETLKEFREVMKLYPDIIMLDNMSVKEMKQAVQLRNRAFPKGSRDIPLLEASGGITLRSIKKAASTGVEMISVGDLTHSLNSVDISLEIL